MITTSTTNSSACEVCGGECADRYARSQAARDCGARYVKTRRNRTRIDGGYWDLPSCAARLESAGVTHEWLGKLVCEDCFARFSRAING